MDKDVSHLDSLTSPQWMTTAFVKTPEGHLTGRAVVTSTGIFSYLRKDGSISRELRLPEEVFAPEFLESLKNIPITLDHIPAVVTAQNADQYAIGRTGTDPSDPATGTSDNYYLAIGLNITRADGVTAVEKGKQSLSVGYVCDLEPAAPGAVWCGQRYDSIQRNLRANHLSIVGQGRAGDAAKIRLDGAEEACIQMDSQSSSEDNHTQEVDDMADDNFKSVKLDGVEYKAEAKVLEALHAAGVRVDGLVAELGAEKAKLDLVTADQTKLTAERDAAQERADASEAALAELKKSSISRAEAMAIAKARLDMEDFAQKAGVEVKEQDDNALMREVLEKKGVKLDGKDDLYVKVRFDILKEEMHKDSQDDAASRAAGGAGGSDHNDSADTKIVTARTKMLERQRNAYKAAQGGK